MTQNDYDSFCEIVLGFAELKSKQLSAPALQLFWNAMKHWPMAEFSAAANHLVRTCEFFPGPDKFEALRKAGRPTAGEAWARALHFVQTGFDRWTDGGITRNKLQSPDDPAIERAVKALGGYKAIAHCESDKLHFLERRFAEHYETMQDAHDVRSALPQLTSHSFSALKNQSEQRKLGHD